MYHTTVIVLLCLLSAGPGRAVPVSRIPANSEVTTGAKPSLHSGLKTVIALMDRDTDGYISHDEFTRYYSAIRGRKKAPGAINQLQDYLSHQLSSVPATAGISVRDLLTVLPNRVLKEDQAPHQVHLSFVNNDFSSMNVIWMTPESHNSSIVQYRPCSSPTSATTAQATERTYDVGLTGWRGSIYQAVMTRLTPDTSYCYRCGSDAGGWSQNFTFTTPSTQPQATTYATYGDMGTVIPLGWAVSNQIARDMAGAKPYPFSGVLHLGDMAYAGTGSTAEWEPIWDLFCDQIEPISSHIPYMTVVGNHEHYYNYTSFLTRFSMPKPWGAPSATTGHVFWFSLDHYYTHFTFMSTEHPYDAKSEQYTWLKADLAAAKANPNIKWIVLMGHRPMYSSDTDEWNSHRPGAYFQEHIEPLMIEYGVDLYLCGHMHAYERVHPNINGTVKETGNAYKSPGAPVHVLQGTAGVFTDHSWITPTPAWSAARLSDIGYGRLNIVNASYLSYDYYRLSFDETPSAPQYIIDSFSITK